MPSSKAIVLSREPFGESDLYVQFLTRDWGMLTVVAKAGRKSRRRYAGGLDIFCHNEIFIKNQPRDGVYLNELTVLNSFTLLRDNLDRLQVAGRAVQWIKRLADVSTPLPHVYSLLGQTLSLIEKETDAMRLEVLFFVFKMKLVDMLGIRPEVESCAKCHGSFEGAVNFDFSSGGVLCRTCAPVSREEHRLLDADDRDVLSRAFDVRLTEWSQTRLSEGRSLSLSRLITQFTSFHTHVRLPV